MITKKIGRIEFYIGGNPEVKAGIVKQNYSAAMSVDHVVHFGFTFTFYVWTLSFWMRRK